MLTQTASSLIDNYLQAARLEGQSSPQAEIVLKIVIAKPFFHAL